MVTAKHSQVNLNLSVALVEKVNSLTFTHGTRVPQYNQWWNMSMKCTKENKHSYLYTRKGKFNLYLHNILRLNIKSLKKRLLHCGNVLYSFTTRWSIIPGNRTILGEQRPFKWTINSTIRNLFSISTSSPGTNLLAASAQSLCLKVRTLVQAYHFCNFQVSESW